MDFNLDIKPNTPHFYRQYATSVDDEIVISGVSGRFPNSHNVAEFAYKLHNKIDCCDDDERRWRHRAGIPKRQGKVYDLEKFDAQFFGFNHRLANATDPQTRCLVEHAYEAVLDAGVNPVDLKGSNTGVYTSVCTMESTEGIVDIGIFDGYTIVGQNRGMLANRISYALDLNGPSFVVDSACSSTMMALNCAYTAIRNGECDAAIVGGSNLTLAPLTSLQFARLGVLAMDGYCRPFDKNASGYTRSEAISAIFIQKRKLAKRVYATLIHTKVNCDGYKPEGITYPAGHIQQRLLHQFYEELGLSPLAVSYVEAHGTGTNVGDPEECEAIYQTFCKGRKEPLLVGSVKSSIGHSEPVSGICSIIKCILALESGQISPNINFEAIKEDIAPLRDGHLKVVDELTDLPGPLVACSSFGFGGANGHVLLKQNPKRKINFGIPADGLPRLVCWSGRTEESCNVIFDDVVKRPLDAEFIGLLHSCQTKSIQANMFRGYGVFSQEGTENAVCVGREVERAKGVCPPLVWVYSGMGSQWTQMGSSLMALPVFRKSIEESHRVLEKKGLNLIEIITSDDKKMFDNILHSFVGIAAIQIGLTNILREMNLEPDYIIGHSVGELGCAYADNCLTAEEMVLCAYSRGMASLETKVVHGSMAAIGLGYEKIRPLLPEGIEAACHNGPNSCTISGPADLVAKFVKELTDKNIFAREVPCSNIPYHSKYIAAMGPKLLERLEKVITSPKQRSAKWLSTSVPQSNWDRPETKICSAAYQTNNLLSSVLFEETMRLLPENAVTVEIAPHGLLQAILKKAMPESYHISLTQRNNLNNINILLAGLGKIYHQGYDIPVEKLYPPIEFPVSAGTPMISHLIKWDHSTDYLLVKLDGDSRERGAEQKFNIVLTSKDYEYISGHKIDGRILFPATGYLYLAWNSFARFNSKGSVCTDQPVEISDIKFVRATTLQKGATVVFSVILHPGTGRFEITESDATVVTGHIKVLEKFAASPIPERKKSKNSVVLKTPDFYKELKLRGYHYDGEFKSVLEADGNASRVKIAWNDNWVAFMDCMLQIGIIGMDSRSLMVPTGIDKVQIDPKMFLESIQTNEEGKNYFDVHSIQSLQVLQTTGIRMQGMKANTIMRRKPPGEPVLENYQFIPYILPQNLNVSNALRVFVQLGLEMVPSYKLKVLEIGDQTYQPVIGYIQSALEDLPMISAELILLSNEPELEIPGVTVDSETDISKHADCLFIVGSNIASDSSKLEKVSRSCKDRGLIISTESYDFGSTPLNMSSNFELISVVPVDGYSLVMIQFIKKRAEKVAKYLPISMKDTEFEWLEKAKEAIKQGTVYFVAQNEPLNGVIGFVNCLRREPKSDAVCIFIDDKSAPPFDPELPFYKQQIDKGLPINVYRDGVWGSYRHLPLNKRNDPQPQTGHCFASSLVKGDLSSLAWFAGRLDINQSDIIKIRYSSLNFRDVMIATGKLDLSQMYTRLEEDCITGLEFSGITKQGKRVMGMVLYGAMATYVEPMHQYLWDVPPHWTMEEAATVPIVYSTVYASFFISAKIESGKKILIHAGTGGIGLSAIRVAFHYGLDVFTTVSTEEKKQYLLNMFPQLKASHIGNSRDTSFYDMVMTETDGEGVDYVLNSLADDKLITSLRCLAEKGHFLEIGKYDILNDSKIGLGHFMKNVTFHVVMLDKDMRYGDRDLFTNLHKMIQRDIDSGVIVPLRATVFEANEMEKAFRYLASAKHMGKVLLKIREDDFKEETVPIIKNPMVYFNPNLTYIIPGGLGGFGLELADWLVLRGARKLVLSSSKGISKPYQEYRINLWRSYGAQVTVSTANIKTAEGCLDLIKTGMKLGPVGGIFNLAVLLRDNIFENQDAEKFNESFSVKANATKYLDEISRKLCPQLEHFVVFSSVSCGRGNAGQTNYGMANSVMERIVETRVRHGLPGKAIQWGAVGEVGLVAQMAEDKIDMEIGGTLQQRISSCLQVLDVLLSCPDAVVGSMVVAEKKARAGSGILDTVMNIIGIKDTKSIPMDQKLSEVGMDSLMAVEIKQTLERDYELILSPQDLRNLTLQSLIDMTNKKTVETEESAAQGKAQGLALLFRNLGDEEGSDKLIVKLNTLKQSRDCAIIFPGVEGVAGKVWYDLAAKLNFSAAIVQYFNTSARNIDDIIDDIMGKIQEEVMKGSDNFTVIAYSFGSVLALALVSKLEELGIKGKLVIIEGSPIYLQKSLQNSISSPTMAEIEFYCACICMSYIEPSKSQEMLMKCKSYDEMIEYIITEGKDSPYSEDYARRMMHLLLKHVNITYNLTDESFRKIKTNITLIRASDPMCLEIDEDYELSKLTSGDVTLKCIESNHMTILDTEDLAEVLNELLQ
ncbi:fatty acid synthase-like [Culicoides brevitarsis]|uniref:fatty acid synthase-like n=1 Tax=Culicoides brevitarsis TaxID=469753 RepID=UPI00307C3EDC